MIVCMVFEMQACTSLVDDMGPGTYFLRIILEGGRGDNMRSSDNEKKKKNGVDSGRNNNGKGNGYDEDIMKSNLHGSNDNIIDNITYNTTDAHSSNVSTSSSSSSSPGSVASSTQSVKRSSLPIQDPALIQRVIFCSGKV